jgi:hypothetical protein
MEKDPSRGSVIMKHHHFAYFIATFLTVVSNSSVCGQSSVPYTHDCNVEQVSLTGEYVSFPEVAGDRSEIYYLYPYNMHLTSGAVSAEPLIIRDESGNPLSGTVTFFGYDGSLISIDPSGYVTALRAESGTEIGTWVNAQYNGHSVANTCIVRVLSQDYGLSFTEVVGDHIVLWYPTSIDGEDMSSSSRLLLSTSTRTNWKPT